MNKLWYKQPAKKWTEALPLGNGRLGCMVFGEPFDGHVQFNEESMVSGGPVCRINPDAKDNLESIRTLIKEGKIKEAEDLSVFALSGVPQSMRHYQTMGDLYYNIKHSDENIIDYIRELDLEKGIINVSFTQGKIKYGFRFLIASDPDVMVMECSTNQAKALSMTVSIERGRYYDHSGSAGDDCIYFDGCPGKDGCGFRMQVKAATSTGNVKVIGERLLINNTDRILLYVNCVTNFPHRKKRISDCEAYLKNQMKNLTLDTFDNILKKHITFHEEIYHRSVLHFKNEKNNSSVPTDIRLKKARKESDPGLISLYYAYGRYLLTECSRPGGLPANLQGIWCSEFDPPWGCRYTININLEMNYWPVDICNLSECSEPLFDLMLRMDENGKETAEKMYGCRGSVAHHNTDIWADTAPQDLAKSATYWVMGGAWLCTHIMRHYRYTRDKNFLKKMFPVLKNAVLFLIDFSVCEDEYITIIPSVSPENSYILRDGKNGSLCAGCTLDDSIMRDLFTDYLKCAEILNDEDIILRETVQDMLEKIRPYKIGKYGQLAEWHCDYEESEPGHRHFSNLYGLFPSGQISPEYNTELADACRISINRRISSGGGHTGWSLAWLICMYACLKDSESAKDSLYSLITGEMTAVNLFDLHPMNDGSSVFQIDGNFGALCGIALMFLQSSKEEITILPALPESWPDGHITGLKAQGGFEFDIAWENHSLKKARLKSLSGEKVKLRSSVPVNVISNSKLTDFETDAFGRVIFNTEIGSEYVIIPEALSE